MEVNRTEKITRIAAEAPNPANSDNGDLSIRILTTTIAPVSYTHLLAPDQHFYDMDISCWEKVTNLNMNGTVYPSLVFSKVMA